MRTALDQQFGIVWNFSHYKQLRYFRVFLLAAGNQSLHCFGLN